MIWIVLVQALTALSVFMYFRRVHPDEQSWKTTVCAWLGFAGQIAVLALFYHYETFVAAGDALYVRELFTIGSGTFSVPVSWLGIIGVGVPVVSMIYALHDSGAQPREVRAHGPLRQRVRLARTEPGGAARARRPHGATLVRNRPAAIGCITLRLFAARRRATP